MAGKTVQAWAYTGTWSEETRKHPAVNFLEWYAKNIIDVPGGSWDKSPTDCHMTKSWTYQKSTGEVFGGADKAWAALRDTYAPFKDHVHDAQDIIVWEIDGGWQMYGVANVWYNLQAPGDGKMKGLDGKEWDGVMKGCFKFTFKNGGERGVELERTEIYSDPSAALVQMLKRGMVKPEQLMG